MKIMNRLTTGIVLAAIFLSLHCHFRARSKFNDRIVFHDDLHYSTPASKDNGFDLYLPKATTQPTAAVVFVHGGYWRNQSRGYYRAFTGLYENFGLALASRGIATAVIDYRLFPQASPADQLADVSSAVAFLKVHADKYNINPKAIFVSGHSAGGHLALLAAWKERNADIRGVVALSPILDIAHMRKNKEADFNQELTVPFFGAGGKDAEYSPAAYANANAAPALILFAEKDYEYLIEQSRIYRTQFASAALPQISFESVRAVDHAGMVTEVNSKNDEVSNRIAQYIQNSILGR